MSIRWLAFRKLSTLPTREAERVKSLVLGPVEAQVWLQEKLEPGSRPRMPKPVSVTNFEGAESAAALVRERWGLDDHFVESVTGSVEENGGIVVFCESEAPGFHGLSGWANEKIPVVISRSGAADDRRRFNLAHELGHLVMTCARSTAAEEEKLAHRFAAAFIVSASVARRELGARRRRISLDELALLKRKYGLSMQAWAYRAADLGIIERRHLSGIFTTMSARGWRKSEPVEFKGHEEPSRLRQLALRALAEGVVTRDRAAQLCPGATTELTAGSGISGPQPPTARELLRLPPQERNRILAEAAVAVEQDYSPGGSLRHFDAFGDKDLNDDADA